jgi:hypothetical protein
VAEFLNTLVEEACGNVGSYVGRFPEALADVHEVLLGVADDLEEGFRVLGGNAGDSVMEAGHDSVFFPQRQEGQFAASDERQAAGTRHIRPEQGVLEGLLATQVRLDVKKGRGELGSPKEG